ncbi:hypothetical protein MRY87_09035 [bacterium]|nr:hypothetical protein [bacterium]
MFTDPKAAILSGEEACPSDTSPLHCAGMTGPATADETFQAVVQLAGAGDLEGLERLRTEGASSQPPEGEISFLRQTLRWNPPDNVEEIVSFLRDWEFTDLGIEEFDRGAIRLSSWRGLVAFFEPDIEVAVISIPIAGIEAALEDFAAQHGGGVAFPRTHPGIVYPGEGVGFVIPNDPDDAHRRLNEYLPAENLRQVDSEGTRDALMAKCLRLSQFWEQDCGFGPSKDRLLRITAANNVVNGNDHTHSEPTIIWNITGPGVGYRVNENEHRARCAEITFLKPNVYHHATKERRNTDLRCVAIWAASSLRTLQRQDLSRIWQASMALESDPLLGIKNTASTRPE